jgi:hypothetical protein
MTMLKLAIFDAEIVKAIPPKNNADRLDDIQYCDGWTDYQGMGISTVSFCHLIFSRQRLVSETDDDFKWVVARQETSCFRFGTELTADDMRIMIHNDREDDYLFGGFNSRKFDDKLFQANGVSLTSDFDLFEMILEAAGLKGIQYWKRNPKPSYTLDSITKANGMIKTGHGELAPIMWQRGDEQGVIDYCENDSLIEGGVAKLLLNGELIDPNTGNLLRGNFTNA